jgi:serine phosphatase RsbU (regulator of sigma subunit)
LSYVDCGHGYAILQHKDGTIQQLDQGGGPPIGVDIQFPYKSETAPLQEGARMMVVSDGIIEQYNALPADTEPRRQFGVEGLKAAIAKGGVDEVAGVFAAVIQHAGTDRLSDDATAALVRWEPSPIQ